MTPLRGEIWLADLGIAGKVRPVIIVSRDDPAPPRALTIFVPVTTQNRRSNYEVELPQLTFLQAGSVANVQGIASLPESRFVRKLGNLRTNALASIEQALLFALNMAA